jgi:hypothetical protein
MKLTEQKLREIIREELKSNGTVSEIAPVIAAVARQAVASAVAKKVSEQVEEGIAPGVDDVVKLVTASADMYDSDDNEDHKGNDYIEECKEVLENAIAKIATQVATDAASAAIAKKMS